ncbi:MAG: DedD protein [Pseudomonadota bacterium]|jgi:DedD protein
MGLFSFPGKSQQDADDDLDVPVKPRRSRRSPTQDEEPIDPMLPEKQRARRRLIGATALVLAAIIGLPMIFDADPNKPLADDVETQIPDKASPANDSPTSLPAQPSAPQTVTQKVVEPPAPAQATVPVPPKAASDLKPAPEPAKSEPVKTVKPNSEASEKPASDKAAERKATAEEDKSQAKEKPRKYLLQVAAVNSKAKADDLKSRLKESGIKAYSEKVSTKDGDRFRVRVGPFASREEAEKMQARVKKIGLNGSVQSM